MKKKMKLLPLMGMSVLMAFAACDPGYDEKIEIVNHSGHDVTMTRYTMSREMDDSVHVYRHDDFIPVDSSWTHGGGGIGSGCRPCIEWTMSDLMRDSVIFTFDDGTHHTFIEDQDTLWGPYAFHTDKYTYEERVNGRGPFEGYVNWTHLTYTLTEADYLRMREEMSE